MQISFNPPLGSAVNVATPPLLPQTHTTPLLFTVQLGATDYGLLVRESGRVQLWSNIPHAEGNGDWGELNFADISDFERQPSDTHSIQFGRNPPPEDCQAKTLYLLVFLLPTNTGTQYFSFTYRIVYASGDVTWLGAFGHDGTIKLQQSPPDKFNGLVLGPEWEFDQSRRVQRQEIREKVNNLQIAKLNNPSDFRIWALGTHSFMPHFSNAPLFFFVPHVQQDSVMLLPTYVIAASPGLFMTLSHDGVLTASGSGTILFQIHEMQSEIQPFVAQIIHHTMLENWSILANDPNGKTMILALIGPSHPMQAVVIPLWPSEYMASTIRLDLAKSALGDDILEEFALFFPFKRQLHYFSPPAKEGPKSQNLSLEVDRAGTCFTLSPVYRLRTYNSTTKKIQGNWAAAILTPYNTVSPPIFANDLGDIPTPPPYPHMRRTGLTLMSLEPVDALLSFVPSSPSNASEFISSVAEDSNNICEPPLEDLVGDEGENPCPSSGPIKSAFPRNILSSFKSVFSSLGIFLRFFFEFFWIPINPFGFDRNPRSLKTSVEDPKVENSYVDLIGRYEAPEILLDEHAPSPDIPIPSQIGVQRTRTIAAVSENGDTYRNTEATGATLLEGKVSGTKNIDSSGASHAPDKSEREDILYVELMFNRDDTGPNRSTATIVLMPAANDTPTNSNGDAIDATSSPSLNGFEKATKFLDGSSPQYTVSEVDLLTHNGSTKGSRFHATDRCYLLQYQLDWVGTRKGSVIGISSPEGSD